MMMQVETQELTLFRSVNAALGFALNFKHGTIKTSGLSVLMAGSGGKGRGLSGLDGAGTAGMIRAEIDAIDPVIRSQILIARFAVKALPCGCNRACCSGWHPNAEWLEAVAEVAEAVRTEALVGCSVNFLLRHAMVRRYFGVRLSVGDAATASGVDRDTASAHMGKIASYLKSHEQHARYAIEGRLKAAGIVE